jgi:hypothetical protein
LDATSARETRSGVVASRGWRPRLSSFERSSSARLTRRNRRSHAALVATRWSILPNRALVQRIAGRAPARAARGTFRGALRARGARAWRTPRPDDHRGNPAERALDGSRAPRISNVARYGRRPRPNPGRRERRLARASPLRSPRARLSLQESLFERHRHHPVRGGWRKQERNGGRFQRALTRRRASGERRHRQRRERRVASTHCDAGKMSPRPASS